MMYFFWPNNNAFDVPKTYLLYQFLSLLAGAAFLISVAALLVLRLAVTQSAGENGWTLPIYGGLTFKKTWNFMVMVIYGYPKLPEGFQEEKWGFSGWRVALRFSKWVDSQTLVRVTE